MLRDLTEEYLRASAPLKWAVDEPGVIEAWVAEMDFALPGPVIEAVQAYAARGVYGYPTPASMTGIVEALAGFAERSWGHRIDRQRVVLTGDVMEGIRLTLSHLAEPGPVIVPTPVYPPFLLTVRELERDLLEVPIDPDAARAGLDLAGIAKAIAAGGRTLLLCHPHNPVGRAWDRVELTALRDVVEPHGVRVISDEIHAPLVHPGVEFVPYAAVATADAPVTTLVSATKAFSMPGLRCAQLISHRAADHLTIAGLHPALNHGMTSVGQWASAAAYRHGDDWLALVREQIAANHALFRALVAERLPSVRIRAAEATYLAWLDVRALGVADPVGRALHTGRVRIDGQDYGAGSTGHVRVNLATSTERVREIVDRLARAWSA
jgi:cystathionine beta-lyase